MVYNTSVIRSCRAGCQDEDPQDTDFLAPKFASKFIHVIRRTFCLSRLLWSIRYYLLQRPTSTEAETPTIPSQLRSGRSLSPAFSRGEKDAKCQIGSPISCNMLSHFMKLVACFAITVFKEYMSVRSGVSDLNPGRQSWPNKKFNSEDILGLEALNNFLGELEVFSAAFKSFVDTKV